MNQANAVLGPFLRRLKAHASLSRSDEDALLRLPFIRTRREQYSYLVRQGDNVERCFILLSGYVQRHRLLSDGARQISSVYLPGDPVNFDHLFLPVADDSLQVIRASELALVRYHDLRDIMAERPGIGCAISTTLAVDASISREWMLNVGRRDARQRIAHLFCELLVRQEIQGPPGDRIDVPLTHDHIADATGLTPVHVNRTLKRLQAEGLLTRDRAFTWVRDRDRLRDVADFNANYLHVRTDHVAAFGELLNGRQV